MWSFIALAVVAALYAVVWILDRPKHGPFTHAVGEDGQEYFLPNWQNVEHGETKDGVLWWGDVRLPEEGPATVHVVTGQLRSSLVRACE